MSWRLLLNVRVTNIVDLLVNGLAYRVEDTSFIHCLRLGLRPPSYRTSALIHAQVLFHIYHSNFFTI